jgi:gliding motility-associated-like protein
MKRFLGFLVFSFFCFSFSFSQTTQDTMDNPYWIDMMAVPAVNFYQTQRAFELYWTGRTIEKGSGYKPFKRWEYNMSQIIDANGNIPAPGSLETTVENYLKTRAPSWGPGGGIGIGGTIGNGSATCQTTGDWKEIGPDYLPGNRTGQPNGIGRINAVAFHPSDSNIIYAGAPAGGVWITKDGGQTWTTNTDSLATLGVSSIAIDPQYPDTIYLGTGDRDASDSYGRGIFKSTDGGQTWIQFNSGMGNVTVGKLIIDPNNTQILIAATSSGIYRTTNGGSSWTRRITGNYKDLVFDAVNTNIIFAARTSARLYKSTDNGVNFSQVTNGLPTGKSRLAIAVTPADSNFVYVVVTNQRTFQGLYLSTNRGTSFTQMSNSPNIMDYSHLGTGTSGQAWYDLDIAADPSDKTIVNVCGVNIFQSKDSGTTWKINAHWVGSGGAPDVHADNHVMEYQPSTNTLFAGNDGGVYFTRDLGKNWTDISEGMGISQIYRLGQSQTQKNYVINGYQDNGTGWYENSKWYTVVGGDGMDCVIDPTNENFAYSALYYGDVRRVKNGYSQGTIAKNGKNGITEAGGWVTPYVLREGTPSTMFVGYKNIWRSTNIQAASVNSVTWTKISNNVAGSNTANITYVENATANSNILYVSRSGNKFFKSTDVNAATPSWTDLTSNLPNNSSVLWIESHPKFQNRVWICQSNKVYQSNTGGSSWSNISTGLPNIPILSLVFDSSSKYQGMYAGTYMGVFYKDTTMSSWVWFNDNMPINTRVRDIEIYHSPNGRSQSHVICATYGRGNWRSPLYDEDQKTPVAGFTEESAKTCQGQAVSFTDTSENLPTNWLWQFTPNTVSFVNGTDSCSQNPQVVFNATGTYSVKMYAENCVGYDSTEKTGFIEVLQSIKASPCEPVVNNPNSSSGIGIFGLKLDKYTYTSSGTRDDGTYIDMGCTEVLELKTDTFYITEVTTGKNYKEYVRIYIDFNNNGDLDDSGELVYDTYEKPTHSDTIKIPSTAATNVLLRMRVMSDYNTLKGPCDTLNYGQTEDYGVIFDASIPTPHFGIDTNRICVNSQVTLFDSSTGPIYKRRWYMSKYGLLTYKTDASGPVNYILPDTGWWYAELVLNDSIVAKRIDSIVYVAPYPTTNLAFISGSTVACEGESLRLKNTTDKKLGTFEWFHDGVQMTTLDDSVITLGTVLQADSGQYYSTIEYNGCKATSNVINISIYPVPDAIFGLNTVDSCLGTNKFDFTNSSTLNGGSMNYSWDFGDGSSSSIMSPTHTYTDTGSYSVRLAVNSQKSCTDTAYLSVHVSPSPKANFNISASPQCLTGNNFTYTNASNISGGGMTYTWNLGNGNTASSNNTSQSYATADTFDVQLIATSNQNCADTIVLEAVVSPSPVAGFDVVSTDSCFNSNRFDFINSSTIATGIIFSNNWEFGNGTNSSNVDNYAVSYNSTGGFSVELIVESNSGCKDTVSKLVTVYGSPTSNFTVNDTIQCFNDHNIAITELSTITGGSITSYNWDFGDGNSSVSMSPPNFTFTAAGSYVMSLAVNTGQNCADTFRQSILINPSPEVAFTGGMGCIGDPIQFNNTSTISSGTNDRYIWNFGDGQTSTTDQPSHIYANSGTYEVKLVIESDQGCIDSFIDKTAAIINAKPSADFISEKISSFESNTEMQFTETGGTGISWSWYVDNMGVGTGQTYTHNFTDTGTFNVMLWVENVEGCRDSVVKSIFIFPDATLHVPTSFSPNADGLNDVFKPLGVRFVKEYHMSIYNRWGNLLYETTDPSKGWDGTFAGKTILSGQYLVLVEIIDYNNLKAKHRDMVTILR